jgi:hypothetical protein
MGKPPSAKKAAKKAAKAAGVVQAAAVQGGAAAAQPQAAAAPAAADEKQAAPEGPRVPTCSICKQPGHNRRSCPVDQDDDAIAAAALSDHDTDESAPEATVAVKQAAASAAAAAATAAADDGGAQQPANADSKDLAYLLQEALPLLRELKSLKSSVTAAAAPGDKAESPSIRELLRARASAHDKPPSSGNQRPGLRQLLPPRRKSAAVAHARAAGESSDDADSGSDRDDEPARPERDPQLVRKIIRDFTSLVEDDYNGSLRAYLRQEPVENQRATVELQHLAVIVDALARGDAQRATLLAVQRFWALHYAARSGDYYYADLLTPEEMERGGLSPETKDALLKRRNRLATAATATNPRDIRVSFKKQRGGSKNGQRQHRGGGTNSNNSNNGGKQRSSGVPTGASGGAPAQ